MISPICLCMMPPSPSAAVVPVIRQSSPMVIEPEAMSAEDPAALGCGPGCAA